MTRKFAPLFVLSAFVAACYPPPPANTDSGQLSTDSGSMVDAGQDAGMVDAGPPVDAGMCMADGGTTNFAGTYSGTDSYTFSMCTGGVGVPVQMIADTFAVTQSGDAVTATSQGANTNCTITANACGDGASVNPVTCMNTQFMVQLNLKAGSFKLTSGTLAVDVTGTATFTGSNTTCNLAITGMLPKS